MKKIIYTTLIIILISIIQLSVFNITSFASESTELETYSPACILIESSTGKIIYEKNAYEKLYPASTTKIMTAILTLENCELTDVATASYNSVYSIPAGYTNANIQVGEELTIDQLLHVLLIPSANDAAVVLAEHIAGSVDNFANMMNEKAKELGCLNTHFVNPNGIHNEEHFSTAYDLSLMARYAMQNSIFRNIVSSTHYTLPATNKYSKADRVFNTTNELLREDNRDRVDNYYYPYANGIKTGYTDPAKNCLVSSAKRDGLEFIAVVLGAERTPNGLNARAIDSKNMFEYAFNTYTIKKINDENAILKQIEIPNATKDTKSLNVIVKDSISVIDKKDNPNELTPNIEFTPNLKAPISKGSIIGKISYTVEDITYSTDLIAGNDVIELKFLENFVKILIALFILFLIYKIIRPSKSKRKNITLNIQNIKGNPKETITLI